MIEKIEILQHRECCDFGEGSSIVVDFKGKVIAQRMTSPIITTELNPALLAQFREKFPAWRDADEFRLL